MIHEYESSHYVGSDVGRECQYQQRRVEWSGQYIAQLDALQSLSGSTYGQHGGEL